MRQFSRSFMTILFLGSFLSVPLPLLAQTRHSLSFIPPDDHVGEPSNTGSGGSRSGERCLDDLQDRTPLTILAPKLPNSTLTDKKRRGGRTISSFPAFFVYIPDTRAETGNFQLLEYLEDGRQKELYYKDFPLPDRPGIVRISLPIALETGKTYEWNIALLCKYREEAADSQDVKDDRSLDVVVRGEIERVSLSEELAIQMDNASLEMEISLYGKAGLWYDFFGLLTAGIPRSPQLREAWQTSLITDIDPDGLILPNSFLSCCSLPPEGE